MKSKVKELLLESLPKYTQIRGQLRTEKGFSILGVICDIYNPDLWKKNCKEGMKLYKKEGWYYQTHIGILSPEVSEWAGTGFQGESWGQDLYHKKMLNIGAMNEYMTFEELAEAIQNHESLWDKLKTTSSSKENQVVNLFSMEKT